MKFNRIFSCIFFLGILLLSGCAMTQPKFKVQINSISSSSDNSDENNKNSYILLPGNKKIKAKGLQFKEYENYVNYALIKQGFVPATSAQEANIAIFLTYGISDSQTHQQTYAVPVWGRTESSSSYTGDLQLHKDKHSKPQREESKFFPPGKPGSNSNTLTISSGHRSSLGTTLHAPNYGIVGSNTHTDTYTTYFHFMTLDAVDLKEQKKTGIKKQLWETTATSTGSSNDLRSVFPILVAASQQYIGKNIGKKVNVNLYESDKRVVDIKGITKTEKKAQ